MDMWVIDFWRAFMERPKILRWIARLAMGRYAYRELYGTYESCLKLGYPIDVVGYELQDMDYHRDKVPTL